MYKNYAFLRLTKLKTPQKLITAHNHNMRMYDVKNADLNIENEELVRSEFGNYYDMVQQALADQKARGVEQRTIRKDAVLGFEIVLSTSEKLPDEQMDEWKEANVKWLQDTFGKDNLKHAVVHNDETTPHIHAFVVPIDEKGHLNAKAFTGGKAAMQQMQTSYAKAMEPFGLSRGVKGTVSRHKDIQYFYSKMNEMLQEELPPIREGETAQEYKKRADETYKAAIAINFKQNEDIAQERNEMQNDRRFLAYLDKIDDRDELVREIKEIKRFKEGVKKYPAQEIAEETYKNFALIAEWEFEQERKRKEKEQTI